LEVIYLTNNLQPDHWVISNFRKENSELIKSITINFRRFLKDSGYIKGKSISTDGTKIKAYASRETLSLKLIEKKMTHVEKEIERYLTRLNENDAQENEQAEMLSNREELEKQLSYLQAETEKLQAQKQLLESLGRESLAPADPQANIMKTKDGFLPAYNVQSTTDNESHFITTFEVTDYPNDFHSLEDNFQTLEEQLDMIPEVGLADGGYANEEQIQSLEKKGIKCVIPFAEESETKKIQRDNGVAFTYDKEANCFQCSQGKTLSPVGKNCKKKNRYFDKYQCKECWKCAIKQYCTTSETGRIIYRRVDGEWVNAHKKKMKTKEYKSLFKQRKCVVEHPFGTMKYYMGQIPILLRGKKKVQIEMDLYATGYNLIRLRNTSPVSELLEKLAIWRPFHNFSEIFDILTVFCAPKSRFLPVYGAKMSTTAFF
jgi:hypothetical protein